MRITLKAKILGMTVAAAILPVLVILALLAEFRASVAGKTEGELRRMGRDNITQIVRDVYNLCTTANDLLQERVNHNLAGATDLLARRGGIRAGRETAEWTATEQSSGETQTVALPKLLLGGVWLGQNRSRAVRTPFVDELQDLVGGTATVFERMNEHGDMLRVATNVPDAAGQRAIGTYIAAAEPDGTVNPVVAAVLKGQTYRGLAYILDRPYVTAYEPLRDPGGRVIGMLYAGQEINAMNSLRRAILETKVGHTGYVAVISCRGRARGRYVISKDGARDGDSIWEARDAAGALLIQRMVKNALASPKGEVFYDEYDWKNPGDSVAKRKIAALAYFEPWDWLINAGTYTDDYYAAVRTVESGIQRLLERVEWAGIGAFALALAFAVFLSGKLLRPLGVTAGVARQIAGGNLEEAKRVLGKFATPAAKKNGRRWIRNTDEAHELVESFRGMTASLDALIGQVQRSGIQVNTSTLQIASSARHLEATVAEQAASTREVTATSKEISATSVDLLRTVQGVNETVAQTGAKAESGRADLERMRTAMQQLAQATSSISSKLGVISERANKISSVVAAINKISDQTSLLALNAGIEAEKAGEHGRGFSVVAREISRLADQTAVSTRDIESVVREMQSSVSSGVMEMDRFAEEVRRRAQEVGTVGDQLAGIIEQVQALGPQFETAQEGMNAQTLGAQQISEAMVQLSQAAEQTKRSLEEFQQATGQLNGAVQGLQSEVTRFRISG